MKKILGWTVVILLWLLFFSIVIAKNDKQSCLSLVSDIMWDVHQVDKQTGIVFDDKQHDYLGSVFGLPARESMAGRLLLNGCRIIYVNVEARSWKSPHSVQVDILAKKHIASFTQCAGSSLETADEKKISMKLLQSVTMNPKWWYRIIDNLKLWNKKSLKPLKYCDLTIPKAPAYPSDKASLIAYHVWLKEIIGMIPRDGWGTDVKMYIDKEPATKLIAASAGEDKMWNTGDDMVCVRDIKTGKAVMTNKVPAGAIGTD